VENTKELWDGIWSSESKSLQEHIFDMEKGGKGTVWKGIYKIIKEHFDNINQLHVVELGAGCGYMSALMAKMVHKVSMIDYSDSAIEQSKAFFNSLGISNVEYINANALNLPDCLCNSYDVSMSFGLAEHFQNNDRKIVIKSHFDLLKQNGLSLISVPNQHCLPYQIWKKKRELLNKWDVGLEIPYSRKEFKSICNELNINTYSFIGSSFLSSLNYIFPFNTWKRSLIKRIVPNYYQRIDLIKPEISTPIDSYLGYALVLCGTKTGC